MLPFGGTHFLYLPQPQVFAFHARWWFVGRRAARLADTRASRSNQEEQQEPRAAPPDLCLNVDLILIIYLQRNQLQGQSELIQL